MSISDKSTLVGFTGNDIQIRNLKIENQQGHCSKCRAWKGQLGLEPTPELYIEHLTEIFSEVKRALKKEGTLWLNIGDTYGGGSGGYYPHENELGASKSNIKFKGVNKPKCLMMIPERLAWSLIQDGWILRNKIIWYKPNAMPSSVTDRFSNRWEYVFMFSKSSNPVYWTNRKTLKLATKQPLGIQGVEDEDWEWGECPKCEGCGEITYKEKPKKCPRCKGLGKIKISFWSGRAYYFDLDAAREPHKTPDGMGWAHEKGKKYSTSHYGNHKGAADFSREGEGLQAMGGNPLGKNPGDIFEINTQPFPEAHFAVFPEKLCEKPIKAGCPEEVCKKCGKARERITEKYDTGETQKCLIIGTQILVVMALYIGKEE